MQTTTKAQHRNLEFCCHTSCQKYFWQANICLNVKLGEDSSSCGHASHLNTFNMVASHYLIYNLDFHKVSTCSSHVMDIGNLVLSCKNLSCSF